MSLERMFEKNAASIDRIHSALDKLTGDAEQRKQEIDRMFREMDARWAASREELAASLTASREELAASLTASREELAASLTASREELTVSQKRLATSQVASREELTASQKRLDTLLAELAEAHKKTEEAQARTEEIVGKLGGRFGVLVEQLLIPGMCPLMNAYGHNFTTVVPSMTLLKKRLHTQIDLMLYNTTEAMAVEIKAKLDSSDVAYHVERLKKLRKIEDSIFIKGLTLYGAVAGIVIDARAKKLALDNGLYVIKIREDKDKLTADKPQDGKVGKW